MSLDPLSLWLIAGLVLLISEMLSASFFLIFIAMGCFASALAASLHSPLWGQLVVCAIISILGVVLLRKTIQKRMLKSAGVKADIGREIRSDVTILPHQQERITYQGTTWLATNLGTDQISKGDQIVIVGMDGNVLLIRKVD